ncbi:hypothetical protein SDC9_173451 [bioreactor metagenome]|uniref:Uncharacterized protein n=1 Tax=bioreactor metagenome TaxID=1076179 RepID=A0A645GJM4_9ZZZZ
MRIGNFVGRHQPGAQRRKRVMALALGPGAATLQLPAALGHIVGQQIAGHMGQSLLLGHAPRAAADDNAQLNLPVDLVRALRNLHRIARTADRRHGLHEQHGFGRRWQSGLGRVVSIVEARTDQLAHLCHGAAQAWRSVNLGQTTPVRIPYALERIGT